MKKILAVSAAVVLFACAAVASDFCPPPPPMCPPTPPVCAVPGKVEVSELIEVPVTTIVNETRMVPMKKRIYVDEEYTVNETRTDTYTEVRTREAKRKIKVPATKLVDKIQLAKVESNSGRAPRLTRNLYKMEVPTTETVVEVYEETYNAPVKHTYSVPVTKTRKVVQEIEEMQTVTVPVKVTSTETRLVKSMR